MAESPDERLILALRQNDETRDVDYKAATAWDEKDKAKCCGIVKDVLAMANTRGGLIIFGVDQRMDGLFDPSGMPNHMLPSWETTKVNNFVQRYADPPINTRTRRFSDNGKTFIAIDVPPFPDVPHLCIKDFPSELIRFAMYVRTANNESAPIGSSADFSAIIEQAVRNRSDRLLVSVRSILVGATATPTVSAREQFEQQLAQAREQATGNYPDDWPRYTGFREASWWPSDFSVQRFPLDVLEPAAQQAHILYRGWPFLWYHPSTSPPRALQDGIEVILPTTLPYSRYFDYWQLRQSGLFYQYSLMHEDYQAEARGSDPYIDILETAIYVAEAIDCLGRMCDALGIRDEDVTLRLRLLGVQGRPLTTTRGLLNARYQTTLSEIRYAATRGVEEWTAGRVDLSAEITRELLLRFNWSDAPVAMFRSDIQALFDRRLS